jgi:NAD(P)-dependent dehydrogenase (short-subunit alcohol dehydrogenase family)
VTTINELLQMKGRYALITGAAGGLGRVIAETLAELNANLMLVDLPGTDLEEQSRRIASRWSIDVRHVHCNLEHEDERSKLVETFKLGGTPLHCLVNNAAFVGTTELKGWGVPFEQQTIDTWRRALEVNLTAIFDLCKGFSTIMNQAEGANIINVASIYGVFGPDWRLYEDTAMGNPAAYAASKGGVIQLTRWLATTLAPRVRANCISPGGVYRGQKPEFVERYGARTPLGRMAKEDDFRGAIAYLASDMSKYVTGQNILVDGGWGVW